METAAAEISIDLQNKLKIHPFDYNKDHRRSSEDGNIASSASHSIHLEVENVAQAGRV